MGFFLTLILWAAFLFLSDLLKPTPSQEGRRPAGLGDFNFPTATEGRVIPVIWGTVKLEGPNVVWYGDLQAVAITEKVKTGLFSSDNIIKGYRYKVGIQMAICRGAGASGTSDPEQALRLMRIFVDDEELDIGLPAGGQGDVDDYEIDLPRLFGGEDNGQGGLVGTYSFREGSEIQDVPTYLEAQQKSPTTMSTPAYRGTAYLIWQKGVIGTSTSVKPWAFEVRRIPNGLGLTTSRIINGNDANPANVLFEIYTDNEWGLGLPSADIDSTSFLDAAQTLFEEGNGWSFVLDREIEVSQLIAEIERQIDGKVYMDRSTGKWKIGLARNDYDVDDLPLLDETNVIEVEDFSRGSWDDTQNFYYLQFASRGRDYATTYAVAQDMANVLNQGGRIVKSEVNFPGVKDATLANSIAWRELRSTSYPIAKARIIVNREFWDANPTDAFAWSNASLGIVKLAMRVTRVDIGDIQNNRIALDLVQDVFTYEAPSFNDPSDGDWEGISLEAVDLPLTDRKVFEAPRAFIDRDPNYPGLANRVWFGARSQGRSEISTRLISDFGVSGFSNDVGRVVGFLYAGELLNLLGPSGSPGTGTVTVDADPDTIDDLLGAFGVVSAQDIGENLSHLMLVDDEFIACENVTESGGDLVLTNVYRGLLDSAQPASHAAGTRVWMLFVSGNLTDSSFTPGTVNIKPLPQTPTDELALVDSTASTLTLDSRHLKPYPPAQPAANGEDPYEVTTISLDAALPGFAANQDNLGINIVFVRRDFRQSDEVAKVVDESTLPADFPSVNSTIYRMEVRNDPAGANTLLFTTDFNSGEADLDAFRTQILAATNGAVPSRLRVALQTRHTVDSLDYDADQDVVYDFDVSSALSSLQNLGALSQNETSPSYAAPTSGSYGLAVGTALSAGDVEARINGGSWATVISTGNTSGSLAGVTASDTLEFRHTGALGASERHHLSIDAPSSSSDAYAILIA